MRLTGEQMALVSRLLDEALALDDDGRRRWLDTLPPDYQPLSEVLHRMLLPQDSMLGVLGRLETPPPVDPDVNSAAHGGNLEAGNVIGPYELIRPLGVGGMAEVWLARRGDGVLKREVALKLPLRFSRGLHQRFARERDILAGLQHPNIARLYDAGLSQTGQPYLALEYVAGTPVTTYCDAHQLDVRARLELFRQIIGAVQYAHAHLVIHRDLKPSNILVTDEGQVQLLDFGIAKLLNQGTEAQSQLTQVGELALTPDYAAPEQVAGEPITTAVDVYALGVILYEVLSGERPYRLKRDSRGAIEEAILNAEVVAPSRARLKDAAALARGTTPRNLARTLAGDLDSIVSKALKKRPAERYATASEFGDDIARYLSDQVVLAQPDRFGYVVGKFARRHRLGLGVAALLLATLAGGLAATSYEARLAADQRDATAAAQLRSLTQIAAARLHAGDVGGALNIMLDVLPHRDAIRSFTPEVLSTFHEARAADAQLVAMTGHTAEVLSVAFSPDGTRIATASADRTVRIWDAATGHPLLLLRGHTAPVLSVTFAPDGHRLASAAADKTVRLWDAATGAQLQKIPGHSGSVWSVAFSPDGHRLVSASADHSARIWDAISGVQIVMLKGHTDVVRTAAFSPDGRRIITASYDKTARLWDATSGAPLQVLTGHTDLVLSAAFSPDGERAVTASVDDTARTWELKSGRQLLSLTGHTNWVADAAFSRDGRTIASVSYDATIRLWNATTGAQTRVLTGHTTWIAALAFAPDGQRLATSAHDRTARTWDLVPSHQLMEIDGHTSWVSGAVYSPDGTHIASGSFDRTARIWDAAGGTPGVVLTGHADLVNTVNFSADGRRIVTSSNDHTARIWDSATGESLRVLNPNGGNVEDGRFSPDGRLIVTASDTFASVWDGDSGRELRQLRGHTDQVLAARFSPDGRQILTTSWDKTARLWEVASGRQTGILIGHEDRLVGAAYSPDGRRIATASQDRTARIWDATTFRELAQLRGHSDSVETVAFSQDGTRVVTASDDGSARLWNAADGQLIGLFDIHAGAIFSADFSPDGQRIVTGGSDHSLRVFDAHVQALDVQSAWAAAAQFDPLSATERFALGLPAPADVRAWPAQATDCDRAAAAPYDPLRQARGTTLADIDVDVALAACADSPGGHPDARRRYQQGRALLAGKQYAAARTALDGALAAGYASAAIELAQLHVTPAAGATDFPGAVALYEQAWQHGIAVAAYELGQLYEREVTGADGAAVANMRDPQRAAAWYRKGADAGEPHALARLAQQAEAGAVGATAALSPAGLLDAFRHYAAAAERARSEDWPPDEWREWRYRRASLARLLARQGQMQPVAAAYQAVRAHYRLPPPPLWDRLVHAALPK